LSDAEIPRQVVEAARRTVLDEVAQRLGNTRDIARES
jgi:hypothetical protein